MVNIDLHMHSSFSLDGEYEPETLMGICSEAGLTMVALTDHNSVKGVMRARDKAAELGMEYVCAVELDCISGSYNLHVLAYGIDPSMREFYEIESGIEEQLPAYSAEMIKAVEREGFVFDRKYALKYAVNGIITDEGITRAIFADPRNKGNTALSRYMKHGIPTPTAVVDFYWDYFARGKACYVPVKFISLPEAVAIVEKSGGIAVLAHPGINIGRNRKVLDEIIESGVRGIEVYSSYHDEPLSHYYKEYALSNKLLITGGSDFHGRIKPDVKPGIKCDNQDALIRLPLLKELERIKRGQAQY